MERANMKKGVVIIALLILFIGIFVVNAVVDKTTAWHSASEVLISIDGFNMTLQEAIEYGFLVDYGPVPTQHYTSEVPNPGHSADEIWVSIDGSEMSLQDAISTSTSLSGSSPTNSYFNSIDPGQFANQIEVSIDGIEMSLQEAIDSGEFGCVEDCSCVSDVCMGSTCFDGCGGNCNGTKQPDCTGKECGDDGCGGSCGTCLSGYVCSTGGTCVSGNWIWVAVGGGSCGAPLPADDWCGTLEDQPCPTLGEQKPCTLGACAPGEWIIVALECQCVPDCTGKGPCDDDGCGNTCGECGVWEFLSLNQIVPGGLPYCQHMFGIPCSPIGEIADCGVWDCPTTGNTCAGKVICR